MSAPVALVLPQHLFEEHPLVRGEGERVVVWDDPLLFRDADFDPGWHASTIAWRRAAIDGWVERARAAGHDVTHLRIDDARDAIEARARLVEELRDCEQVDVLDPTDEWGLARLQVDCDQAGAQLLVHDTPGFLLEAASARELVRGGARPRMAPFYQHVRREFGILMDEDDEPVGGRWSFDEDNREKLPKAMLAQLPHWPWPERTPALAEYERAARAFAPDAPGSGRIAFPTDPEPARAWLAEFVEARLARFGPYEDALAPGSSLVFHAAITPMLNHGVLTPREVLDAVLTGAARAELDVPLNSLEGFVRQLIGWREFMRACYLEHGPRLRRGNRWGHERALPNGVLTAQTGVGPVDDVLARVLELGWCHHIERLMVLGNWLFLVETHPHEVYRCFTGLFTDALDWVMVPNVYGMSQDAAGGLLTTKPYFSGSAYLRRMGWPKGDWCEVWDALYWRFVIRHGDELRRNPRWAMAVRTSDRFDEPRRAAYVELAEAHISDVRST